MKRHRRSSRGGGTGYNIVWLLVLAGLAACAVFGWTLLPSGVGPELPAGNFHTTLPQTTPRPTFPPAWSGSELPDEEDDRQQQEHEQPDDRKQQEQPEQEDPAQQPSLYETLYEAVDNEQQIVQFTADSLEQAQDALQQILREPEFFWLNTYRLRYTENDYQVTFEWKYDNLPSRRAEVEQMTQTALSSIPAGAGEYETALALHDWLCDRIVYQKSTDRSDQDIYGAMILGRCVCGGYAAAYHYLLEQAGIEVDTVLGNADNGTGPALHAWNRVVLEGETYYTDATWDDQEEHPYGKEYGWFCLTSERMGRTHVGDPTLGAEVIPSTAVACNYHVRNGWMMDIFSTEELVRILSSQSGNVLTVAAADQDTYDQLYAVLSDSSIYDILAQAGHPAQSVTSFGTNGSLCRNIVVEP